MSSSHSEEDPLPTRSLRTGQAVEHMVAVLSEEIVSGQWPPGSRLPAQQIAQRFSVSRTPVREALSQLCAMGLAESRPHRGVITAQVSQADLLAMFEAMAELEAACARLSAQRMTLAERHQLSAMHEGSRDLRASTRSSEYAVFNDAFHSLIYQGSKSDYLIELTLSTRARLAPFRHTQFRVARRPEHSFAEHSEIVAAISAGDAERAAQAVRQHVLSVAHVSSDYVAARSRTGESPCPE
ncbi:GntR family transcriptional regulator [Salinisphaera hydrothermalis]|uniref:GntR, transcriptional regulator GntR n=1 Tax=Salinisphaera hydrothermalis (strain C41B8) TaxID=1304275 RepID=A0A084IRB9_SALHC|nr:GntR family transcriptional regulator [Salinisphaera hydrothermalis]KEZ79253.1 GntR, transcriptional regulator GntR [Salinisphaera hydrothermalis C41B8]